MTFDHVLFFTTLLNRIVGAEQHFGPGTGKKKEAFVLQEIEKYLPTLLRGVNSSTTDITEIIAAVAAVIKAIVALLNLLGVFPKEQPKKKTGK